MYVVGIISRNSVVILIVLLFVKFELNNFDDRIC